MKRYTRSLSDFPLRGSVALGEILLTQTWKGAKSNGKALVNPRTSAFVEL